MFHPYSFYLQKHKNAKSNESLPSHFSASPYYSTSLSIPPMPQTAFYYVPFRHLGYPISPFGISHFTIWGIPFYHLECPISPFGVSHFTIWDIPFHLLGCPILPFGGIPFRLLGYPILPFGVSHFAIWGIPFCHLGYPILPFGVSHFTFWGIFSAHLRTTYSPDARFGFFVFRCKSMCVFFPFCSSCFFGFRLAG